MKTPKELKLMKKEFMVNFFELIKTIPSAKNVSVTYGHSGYNIFLDNCENQSGYHKERKISVEFFGRNIVITLSTHGDIYAKNDWSYWNNGNAYYSFKIVTIKANKLKKFFYKGFEKNKYHWYF